MISIYVSPEVCDATPKRGNSKRKEENGKCLFKIMKYELDYSDISHRLALWH